ncbi:hypothetical protein, partial [Ideonella livida]
MSQTLTPALPLNATPARRPAGSLVAVAGLAAVVLSATQPLARPDGVAVPLWHSAGCTLALALLWAVALASLRPRPSGRATGALLLALLPAAGLLLASRP